MNISALSTESRINMADIKAFRCIRPTVSKVADIAALPYDVYSSKEAREVVKDKPYSFLRIDRAETQLEEDVDIYSDRVYDKAREILDGMIADGSFITDNNEKYYIYELTMNGRAQTGIVAVSSIDDYLNNIIKKHENTRADKEQDRINHVDRCNAQTGPIFLAYRSVDAINQVVDKVKAEAALYDFTSEDGITHRVWDVKSVEDNTTINEEFKKINEIYIADGHHRAASAVKVGIKRRDENPGYDGTEEFNYFLSVLFPDDQLMIMDYNRTVADLNGYSKEEFLNRISEQFEVEKSDTAVAPNKKATFGMYLDKQWYKLTAKKEISCSTDPVKALDVSILQDNLLGPVLGIEDPRVDKRIDFVGGIRGLAELEKRADNDMMISFSMYPTSISELFDVADAGLLMPPKSTWFEPKLRSGIFIHSLS